jgi:hypothetical protein
MPAKTKFEDNNERQTVVLQTPIVRGNSSVEDIQVRTPKAGELRGLSLAELLQLNVSALEVLLPRITAPAITEPEVRNLHPADLVQLGSQVINFLVPADRSDTLSA